MAIFFQAVLVVGTDCFINKWATPSINVEANMKRGIDSTRGCTEWRPIFVAEDAEAHKITKVIPDKKLSRGLFELLIFV